MGAASEEAVLGPAQGAAAAEEVVVVGPAQGVAVEEVAVGLAHGAEPEAEGGALEGPEPREEGTHPLVLLTTLPVGLEGWAPAAGTTTTTMDMKQEERKGTEMAAVEFGWSRVLLPPLWPPHSFSLIRKCYS